MNTNFQKVVKLNEAFNNFAPHDGQADLEKVRAQCANILHEYGELLVALGHNEAFVKEAVKTFELIVADSGAPNYAEADLTKLRDSLSDIHVFNYGAHHLLGIDADRDVSAVVEQVMTRFVKDEADKAATIALHASKGVTDVYFEGEYPKMIMKSGSDQPDAPKGKFLKSASCQKEPNFYNHMS